MSSHGHTVMKGEVSHLFRQDILELEVYYNNRQKFIFYRICIYCHI